MDEKKGRGGARAGAGRKKLVSENGPARKGLATEILDSLGKDIGHPEDCWCQKCLWREDARRLDSQGQAARRYLWDRADGKPVDTVNHLHDKPLEMNVTVSLADTIARARKRAKEQ